MCFFAKIRYFFDGLKTTDELYGIASRAQSRAFFESPCTTKHFLIQTSCMTDKTIPALIYKIFLLSSILMVIKNTNCFETVYILLHV